MCTGPPPRAPWPRNALAGAQRTADYWALPRVTFTSPAIASAGLTQAQLIQDGTSCECRVLPLAIANRDTRGPVKLVAEAGTGRLRGVHAVADNGGEVITAGAYAIPAGMTVADLART